MTVEVFDASTTWTAPAGVTSVTAECWGGGGGGSSTTAATNRGGGGGAGGCYASAAVTVVPATQYAVTVGGGGAAQADGGDSSFGDGSAVLAAHGRGNAGAGTIAGSLLTSVGTVKFAGGAGTGDVVDNFTGGGGGGSSAGTAAQGGAGGNGSGGTGGAGGTAPSGGGAGGRGGDQSTNAGIAAGAVPGGGGGGRCFATGTGQSGASGRVRLTYSAPPVADFTGAPLSGALALSVTFTDATANAVTSRLWEKNDGSGWVSFAGTPTAQNPVESFAVGTWSVRLTATNADGSDTKTRTGYVVVTSPGPGAASGLSGLTGVSGTL